MKPLRICIFLRNFAAEYKEGKAAQAHTDAPARRVPGEAGRRAEARSFPYCYLYNIGKRPTS